MELFYVLAVGLILLVALAVGEDTYPARSKPTEVLPPERKERSAQVCLFPDGD
jgi:hypothetical protein